MMTGKGYEDIMDGDKKFKTGERLTIKKKCNEKFILSYFKFFY
jgi:hypothetical protein